MFMSEVNYTSMESSPQDEISNSDVENVAMSPDDSNRIDVVNVEQSSFDDRSSMKSGRHGDCTRTWTMAKVQVGYDITRKGERSLVVDGFKFTKSRDGTNNRIFWRCSRRECKATAVTVCDRVEHVRAIHAHEPPLAAEFFGSQEGVSQRCQLQEVRFNTSAANMRPRYRRSVVSGSEHHPDEPPSTVKDISNANEIICESKTNLNYSQPHAKPLISLVSTQPIFQIQTGTGVTVASGAEHKAVFAAATNGLLQRTPSVKEQVRDFILRNSNAQTDHEPENGVSVAQFLISPASKHHQHQQQLSTPAPGAAPPSQFLHASSTPTPLSTGSSSSAAAAAATVFNFSTMQINASPNGGSDSTSDAPSHKSTPGIMNVSSSALDEAQLGHKAASEGPAYSQLNLEQIIHLLLHKNGSSRQRSCSDSEWVAANSASSAAPGEHDVQHMSPSIEQGGLPRIAAATATATHSTTPTRFIHWKKEKLRESETCDEQLKRERKRRHDYVPGLADCGLSRVPLPALLLPEQDSPPVSGLSSAAPEPSELCSFLNSFRPTITHKLMGVMQKLSSELCPEEAVAQEVYEKCTAIKTCLETLEKLHSLMTC